MPPEYVPTLRPPASVSRKLGEQVVRDPAGAPEMPQLRDQDEVLPPGEDLVDSRELPGQADRLPHVPRLAGDVEAVDLSGSDIRLQQSGKDLHDRCLAGPVRAEEGENAPPRHVKVHAAQHMQFLV